MASLPGHVQDGADDGVGADGRDATVFRAFEVGEFLEWPAWERLLRILNSNGGSYGLSGPRGSGKSWLMMRAIEWVRNAPDAGPLGGIGLWYPSPSEYNALAFLASLSDSLGTEIDRWYRRNKRVRWLRWVERALVLLVVALVLILGLLVVDLDTVPVVVAAGVAGVLAALVLRARPLRYAKEARLAAEAKLVRERARFTATLTESSEVGAEGGSGVSLRAGASRQRELVERPATLSSLVNDFRALAREAGEVAKRVVIAIDELDKMAKPEKVPALLRDIKGIFEIPHVHFLVSVSDEAVRRLSLGALSGRDEFNSSFYTVIEAQPATLEHIATLLERRSDARVPREVALVLAVLAGGNPREALRLAELAGSAVTGGQAVVKALEHEALALRREVITAPDTEGLPSLEPDTRKCAFAALPDESFVSPDELTKLAGRALGDEMWHPGWSDAGFSSRFGEPWCRLMLRLAVGGQLAETQTLIREEELGGRLQNVVVVAQQSAEIGREVFEGQLRIDTPRAPAGHQPARDRLNALARQYDQIRAAEPSWSQARTRRMDAVAADMRSIARDAAFGTDELGTLLGSEKPGDRVVALACISATGDPALFEPVLDAVGRPPTWFEGYHALRALETLLPSLTPDQQNLVVSRLEKQTKKLEQDPPRHDLARRIIDGIRGSMVKSA